MATAAQLKALRRKYHLGEFRRSKRTARPKARRSRRVPGAPHAVRRVPRAGGDPSRRLPPFVPGYLGYSTDEPRSRLMQSIGVPELGFDPARAIGGRTSSSTSVGNAGP